MRQFSTMHDEEFVQYRFTTLIAKRGVPVTITRRPDTQNGSSTSWRATASAQPMAYTEFAKLNTEGTYNYGTAKPHNFIFDHTVDIQEVTDTITYLGWLYKVLLVTDTVLGKNTTNWARQASGVRIGKAS